jgi:hypothetical protein
MYNEDSRKGIIKFITGWNLVFFHTGTSKRQS